MLAMTAVEDTSVAPPDAAELHLSTPIKPRLRGWLHAVMFPATLFAGVVLTALADSPRGRIACAVYTLSACLPALTKKPSSPSSSRTAWPMRVMVRMETAT